MATSMFNTQWLEAVISIEVKTPGQETQSVGTGFLVSTEKQHTVLVTAGHVVRPPNEQLRNGLQYRRSDIDGDSAIITEEELVRSKAGPWFFSQSADLSCRFFGKKAGTPPTRVIPLSFTLQREHVQTGARMMILGFPLGLRSASRARPIARSGMAARVSPEDFLVETFVFPGNSGGPVVYVPSLKTGTGISSPLVNDERLVGIIKDYIPYQEIAVSPQTKRARVIFEENSGLSEVIPVDALLELLARNDIQRQETLFAVDLGSSTR